MKKISLLTVFLFLVMSIFAQSAGNTEKVFNKVNFGFGGGFGVIYPEDVNSFLGDYFDDALFTDGFPEILFYLHGNLNLQYFVNRKFELCSELTGCWAPKYISGVEPDYYYASAVSPGLIANYHFLSKKKENNSVFIGGGVNYNFLTFKFGELKVKGDTPGLLFQFGMMSTLIGSTPFKLSLAYRYIKADNVDPYVFDQLSFSGVHYTFCYYF